MAEGSFIALDTTQAVEVFLREAATVQTGYVDNDFTSNLVTILSEVRVTIAVERPIMIVSGALTV